MIEYDYIDELLEQHFDGELELEELEPTELNLVLARLQEIAAYKALEGFESVCQGRTVSIVMNPSIH
jgi:hypothetical protein